MSHRLRRSFVPLSWGAFLVWLLASGEVDRYIGPRTQWVVVMGAVTLVALAVALLVLRADHGQRPDRMAVATLILPIVVLIAIPRPTLGSLAASRKLGSGGIASLGTFTSDEISFREISYASESAEFAATSGIAEGVEVELTGFVTPSISDDGTFSLTRFAIFCCAADVVPYSVEIVADRNYSEDVWLEVRGVLEARDNTFVVVAGAIREVPEPSDPYLR